MTVKNRKELYDLLDEYGCGFYIVNYEFNGKNVEEPLLFNKHESITERGHWWLEAPCIYMEYKVEENDNDFKNYLKEIGCINYMGTWFEIDCPQVSPFLEGEMCLEKIKEVDVLRLLISRE